MAPAIWLAGVISALVALPFAEPANVTWQQVPWLLALSPGQLAGGLLLYMASLKRIPAGQAALLGLLELVLGPVWVWLFDGEKPDDLTLLGGVNAVGAQRRTCGSILATSGRLSSLWGARHSVAHLCGSHSP